jgi:hypothetical protein
MSWPSIQKRYQKMKLWKIDSFKEHFYVCKLNIDMVYMIIERFHPGKVRMLYERFAEKCRLLPAGVSYINSWIKEDVSICYQVMRSDSVAKINEWVSHWNDLADFEVNPVINSDEAKEKIFSA